MSLSLVDDEFVFGNSTFNDTGEGERDAKEVYDDEVEIKISSKEKQRSIGFKRFVAALDDNYNLPCPKTFTNVSLQNLYDEDQNNVLSAIREAGWVSLTSDMWKSSTHSNFMEWMESYEQLPL
ncbi:unnamed protein product [Lepeophtheirus salmonis]|uniref:(salmon louse) hypothetical protein n=1 Tax=Lepeophtheirus salmonis TaxID=72036 RepID=A0A7R8CKD2_LEPSM|nr:unnamed protein product [Lepeophtheirus salmonis]CAF2848502.1 unnamed protein product [Lepeophtheirus salmonis]